MRPRPPHEPGWEISQSAYERERHSYYETLFCLSNGYLGLRNTIEFESDHSVPGIFFADVYDNGIAVRTEIANSVNWLPIQFHICDEPPLNFDEANVLSFHRVLNMRDGTVRVTIKVEDRIGRITTFDWLVLVHARHLHLGLIAGTITPENYSGSIGLASYLDYRFGNSYMGGYLPQIQTMHFDLTRHHYDPRAGLFVEAATSGTNLRVAEASRLFADGEVSRQPLIQRRRAGEYVRIRVQQKQSYAYSKLATFFHGYAESDLAAPTRQALEQFCGSRIDGLIADHQNTWIERWRTADVKINGDPAAQETLRFSIFHLLQSVDPLKPACNVAARGLTSEYHSGHFFFNTEFYKLPYWVYVNPDVARSLLMFRYNTLDAARRYAVATGFNGARYPEEVDLAGVPATPWEIKDYFRGDTFYEWSGPETYFLSAAVAYGIFVYYRATRDDEFIWDHALELLLETARFGASVLQWDPDTSRFVIKSVMGPDEYHYHVDNNFFTNYMIRWNIRYALSMLDRFSGFDRSRTDGILSRIGVEGDELESWRTVVDLVYLPGKSTDGVIEQHEGYFDLPDQVVLQTDANGRPALSSEDSERSQHLRNFSTQLIKEADIILLQSLFPSEFTREEKVQNYSYYVKRTTHESSLSASPYGLIAAEIGDPHSAYVFFKLAGRFDLDFIPKEGYRNGLHLAAYAGAWQVVIHGFAGVRIANDQLHIDPCLPAGWESVSFRTWWQRSLLDIRVDLDAVEIRPMTVNARRQVDLWVNNQRLILEGDRSVRIGYCRATEILQS